MKEKRLNQHIHGWLEKIQENIDVYKLSDDTSDDGKLAFISHQYHLVIVV